MSAPVETPSALVLSALREVVGSEHGHRVHCVGTGPDVTPTVAFTSSNGVSVDLDDVSAALFHLACQLFKARAALAEIVALQPIEPYADDHPSDTGFARALGRRQCASVAAKALVTT